MPNTDRNQGIVGDRALLDPLVPIGRPRAERGESFAGKAIRRPFTSRPVNPRIRDLRLQRFTHT